MSKKKILTLPTSRVAALVAETGDILPERAIAKLLSVLHGRKMWAHLDARKSTNEVVVFLYGKNVPTPLAKRASRTRKGVAE